MYSNYLNEGLNLPPGFVENERPHPSGISKWKPIEEKPRWTDLDRQQAKEELIRLENEFHSGIHVNDYYERTANLLSIINSSC